MRLRHRRCVHCLTANFCTRHRQIRLLHRDKLKPCMWINKHIVTHYRPQDLPWSLCMHSIFQWNNETLNVWSHLLGFVWLTYLQYWSLWKALPSVNAPATDYWVMGLAMLCCQLCMLLSSAYHIFGCHSPQHRKRWLRADLFGVSAGLGGLYLSGLYTSFYHFPEVRRLYGTLIGAMIITLALYVPFRRFSIRSDSQQQRRIGLPHLLYMTMAVVALCPTWHWIQLHGGLTSAHVRRLLPNLFTLFLLLGAGFAFYASLVPERIFPGKFDLIGSSHQWWHLLILAAMSYWHHSGITLLSSYHSSSSNLSHTFSSSMGPPSPPLSSVMNNSLTNSSETFDQILRN